MSSAARIGTDLRRTGEESRRGRDGWQEKMGTVLLRWIGDCLNTRELDYAISPFWVIEPVEIRRGRKATRGPGGPPNTATGIRHVTPKLCTALLYPKLRTRVAIEAEVRCDT
jgi:hypothetical protein